MNTATAPWLPPERPARPFLPINAAVVNGINTDGEGNVDAFKPIAWDMGLRLGDPVLPVRNATTARMFWRRDIEILTHYCEDTGVRVLIAHSYGGFRSLKTAEHVEFDLLILYAPAIEHDYDLSKIRGNPVIVVIHSEQDRAIWLGSKLWFHFFGEAGRIGLTEPNNPNGLRVGNIAAHGNRHSTYFRPTQAEYWMGVNHALMENRVHPRVRWLAG